MSNYRCKDGRDVTIPSVTVSITAAVAAKYSVTIGGTTQLVREERDVSHGTAIFRDLVILVLPESTVVMHCIHCIVMYYLALMLADYPYKSLNIFESQQAGPKQNI